MSNKLMNSTPQSYVIRDTQIKTTMKYLSLHQVEWQKSGKLTAPRAAENVDNRNSCSLLLGMQKGAATSEDRLAVSWN